jgi:RHS repeat-associated protein
MSNTSGTSEQVISLPRGGGALHGIGEKFSPDLFTGTGNFTVPIALPPGRNGFQPQLNLVYSTGNGNGPFGLGWSLSVPGVSRKTSKGVPIYDDEKDTFLLSGAEDLVRVEVEQTESGTEKQTRSRYRPRTEGLFARIDHYHIVDTATGAIRSDYWEVRSKDGLVNVYGTPEVAGNDPAVIANPDPHKRQQIFAWKLTSTTDPFGNRIVYEYLRDSDQVGPHDWDQLYLKRISYADYSDGSGAEHFLVSVTFDYGTPPGGLPDTSERPDAFSDYRAGFEIRTRRRCEQIVIETHTEVDQLVRTYSLSYQNDALNGLSLLNQIEVAGHDGDRTEKLPPLTFGYTRFEPNKQDFSPVTGPNMPAGSLARGDQELASLFGNGLPDILQMNGTVRYWRNMGGGKFNLPREMRTAPAGLSLTDKGVQLIDANGDGQIDLLVTTEEIAGYYPQRFGGLWDRRSFQRYRVAPSFDLKDPEVKMVDLDGDGVTDAIRSGTRLECFFNDAHEGWTKTRWVERRALEVFPNVNFSDPRVKWGDMTGDGLQDIVLVYNGIVQYWPSLGRGDWGLRITMQNSPHFPYGYDPKRILVGDVDGDGLADIVYVDDTKVTLWINQSGNSWSKPIMIEGTPPVSDMDGVRLDDMLGSGIRGILWSSDANGLSRANMFFLDFTGGTKPYVLNEMDNHMGAVTRVGYAPSTHFYLEDEKCLATRWKTTLPFPVQVVARVEVIDAISGGKLTTEYSYHHGYWDGAEREFRGFGRVDQRDTEVFEDFNAAGLHPAEKPFNTVPTEFFSPPTETRTWFHQGPIGDEFGDWTETDFSDEFWPGDTQVFSRPASVVNFLKSLPRRVKRDALRAMRGRILRTELYALDGTQLQGNPYTVTEHLHSVREESPPGPGEAPDRLHVFFPHTLAERTAQWERGDDPMHQFKFTSDYDEYGQQLSQINIAVPRGRDFRVTGVPGEPYLVTYTLTSYAQRDDAQQYIVDRIARTITYEILNDGSSALFDLQMAIEAGTVMRRISAQTLNFYDGPAFQGLPYAQMGGYGALVRTESLVLTQDILHEAYKSGSTVLTPPEEPPYLVPDGPLPWTAEYPQEFRDLLPPLVGYTYQQGGTSSEYETGYFVATERRLYDFHDDPGGKGRGLIKTKRDPLGHDTSIDYDSYELLPITVTDAAGLDTQASYDYRILQPKEATDPNGNLTIDAFTPLGLLESTAVIGKNGEGDTPDKPSTQFDYSFPDFAIQPGPIFVRTIRRVHHVTDTSIPLPERDETIETVEYSDGFGRLLQTRTQAEDVFFGDPNFGDAGLPADQSLPVGDAVGQQIAAGGPPNVVVSGWQIYDNKGRVVEKYEPFFSSGWDYAPPTDTQFGQKITMYYDPRGQLIRTVNPDGSEQLVIYGIPTDLTKPDQFIPTAWEVYTYDPNDNAGRTHPTESTSYQNHWNTPSNGVVDALGRKVLGVERNGANPATDWYTTSSTYDIRGNLLTVTDALNRLAFQHVYDLANHVLRVEQLDAGIHRVIVDATGNTIEQRDSKGTVILHAYDILRRPIRLWARDDDNNPVSLRERLEYGDGSDPNQPGSERAANQAANRLGKLYKHYDEAGMLTFEIYDFKGNILEKLRQVISDATILAVFTPPPPNWQVSAFRVDWQPPAGTTLDDLANRLLDATQYWVSLTYDALNRVQSMLYPQDVSATRKALLPHYNRAGALESVKLDGAVYVEHIAYNAKGQRMLTALGNGIMTRQTYDPKTFRLLRMRTEQYTNPTAFTYHPTGQPLQDFAYAYDLVGNMLALHDRTPESGIPNTLPGTDALDRTFTYDPIYRLLSATGRECDVPPVLPWDDTPRCTDLTRTRSYTEQYQYDPVGNMQQLQHQADGGFTRVFALAPQSNRLATMTVGTVVYDYAYDPNGNLVQETTSRHFEWDHSDRMRVYRTQVDNAEPSIYTHYLYDSSGQRVKKLVRNQGGQFEVTVYIDGLFEYHHLVQGSTMQENNTLHVMDHEKRIALVRVGDPFPDDTTPAVKYHLGDHLGSSNVVVDDAGALVNREEYTPYGETGFGSFARKRYRFIGKEHNEESGLYYYGARYYAPWLGRWMSCDPKGMVDGPCVFAYVKNNPVRYNDPNGTNGMETPLSNSPQVSVGSSQPIPVQNLPSPFPRTSLPPTSLPTDVTGPPLDFEPPPPIVGPGTGAAAETVGAGTAAETAGLTTTEIAGGIALFLIVLGVVGYLLYKTDYSYRGEPGVSGVPHDMGVEETPMIAPGTPGSPVSTPGAAESQRIDAPSGGPVQPVTAPGPEAAPVREPEMTEQPPLELAHGHHLLPQKFRPEFEQKGIDIDALVKTISPTFHRRLHSKTGNWNQLWEQKLGELSEKKLAENALLQEIFDFMHTLEQKFGPRLEELPFVRYRRK